MSPEPHSLPETIDEVVDMKDGEAELAIAVTIACADVIDTGE